jgi:tRNA(Ile)-lysidine synthase TilS/MesJ
MKSNYTIDKGDLRVIRPLVTCREKLFKDFSDSVKLPVISDNCPACFSAPKERHRIKLMLAQQENLFPDLFQSILKTIMPLMRCNVKDLIKNGANSEDSDEMAEAALANTCDPNAGAGSCGF